jgi:hypothetical protein
MSGGIGEITSIGGGYFKVEGTEKNVTFEDLSFMIMLDSIDKCDRVFQTQFQKIQDRNKKIEGLNDMMAFLRKYQKQAASDKEEHNRDAPKDEQWSDANTPSRFTDADYQLWVGESTNTLTEAEIQALTDEMKTQCESGNLTFTGKAGEVWDKLFENYDPMSGDPQVGLCRSLLNAQYNGPPGQGWLSPTATQQLNDFITQNFGPGSNPKAGYYQSYIASGIVNSPMTLSQDTNLQDLTTTMDNAQNSLTNLNNTNETDMMQINRTSSKRSSFVQLAMSLLQKINEARSAAVR